MSDAPDRDAKRQSADGVKPGPGGGAPTDAERFELVARVLDLLPDFFYVHDYDLRFYYANDRAAKYFGLDDKSQLIGRLLSEVDRDKAQAAAFVEVCRRVMDSGEPRTTDGLAYRREDGRVGLLRQHDIPFRDPRTGRPMLMGLSRDVTIEREVEAARLRSAMLERELRVAEEVQRALRPDTSIEEPGLKVAAHAEAAAFAGGDFYDWGRCPDGRFLLGLGDVAGHGVGPALLASACRAYVRALVMTRPLYEVMKWLNELISLDVSEGRFVTFVLASIDPRDFSLTLSSAGHGPMFVLRGEGRLEEVLPEDLPLGIVPDAMPSDPFTTMLAPGDGLVLMSDGVYESMNAAGEQFGLPRLRALLERTAGQTPEGIVSSVTRAVREHAAGQAFADDVTIVVAKRVG
jgi:PAS domain S-box-containing protein